VVTAFPDFQPAPNQGVRPDLYELENRAMDPGHLVLDAMRDLAPWAGKTLADLGCGSGHWLPGYAAQAAAVIGIEPDPALVALAAARDGLGGRVRVLAGSAEHIPLPDDSVDVVHARFAYFWPPRCEAGLAEVLRVLTPGGSLVVVDNDHRAGEFAGLLRAAGAAGGGGAQGRADVTDAWWAARGASRTEVMSRWEFGSRSDLESVLRLEFSLDVADPWLEGHPSAVGLSYGYVLFAVTKALLGGVRAEGFGVHGPGGTGTCMAGGHWKLFIP
jgi:SAM-dependent methyltransferase